MSWGWVEHETRAGCTGGVPSSVVLAADSVSVSRHSRDPRVRRYLDHRTNRRAPSLRHDRRTRSRPRCRRRPSHRLRGRPSLPGIARRRMGIVHGRPVPRRRRLRRLRPGRPRQPPCRLRRRVEPGAEVRRSQRLDVADRDDRLRLDRRPSVDRGRSGRRSPRRLRQQSDIRDLLRRSQRFCMVAGDDRSGSIRLLRRLPRPGCLRFSPRRLLQHPRHTRRQVRLPRQRRMARGDRTVQYRRFRQGVSRRRR